MESAGFVIGMSKRKYLEICFTSSVRLGLMKISLELFLFQYKN